MRALFFFLLVVVASVALTCAVAASKKQRGGGGSKVWMDGLENENVQINCPSIRFLDSREHFAPAAKSTSTIRCGACTLLSRFVARRAALLLLRGHAKREKKEALSPSLILEGVGNRPVADDSYEAGDENKKGLDDDLAGAFCEALHDAYTLKQQPDGKRVFARARTYAGVSADAEREAVAKTHLVPQSGNDPGEEELLPLRFHTPEERRTLPCGRYMLRELCFREVSSKEDDIEACVGKANAVLKRQHEKQKQQQKNKAAAGDDDDQEERDVESPQDRRRRLKREEAEEQEWQAPLEKCLESALACSSRWCHPQLLSLARNREFLHYAWYEGAFGDQRFSYVADDEKRGRNKLNPYRKDGEKAHLNPWLNGTWRQVVEDL